VIAFQQDLAASASAHHAMAQIFEARGIVARAHENNHGQRNSARLQPTPDRNTGNWILATGY